MLASYQKAGIQDALLAIPDELVDAATVDGLNQFQAFLWVKLPLIWPTIGLVSILTFVNNFNAFDLIYAMKGALAGPNFSTDIMGTLFYRTFFGNQLQLGNPSMGSTIATMMLVIVANCDLGIQLPNVLTAPIKPPAVPKPINVRPIASGQKLVATRQRPDSGHRGHGQWQVHHPGRIGRPPQLRLSGAPHHP